MKWNLSGAPVPGNLPYASDCNRAASAAQASPCALYAIAWRETIGSEVSGWLAQAYPGKTAATVISPDGGHGIMQLTATVPPDWDIPYENFLYGAQDFYDPALSLWQARGFTGPLLLRLAADDFNAGDSAVVRAHLAGNADAATTGGDYGRDVVQIFLNLIAGRDPNWNRP